MYWLSSPYHWYMHSSVTMHSLFTTGYVRPAIVSYSFGVTINDCPLFVWKHFTYISLLETFVITLHYFTLHYITLHCVTLETLHDTIYGALHYITLCHISLRNISWQYITLTYYIRLPHDAHSSFLWQYYSILIVICIKLQYLTSYCIAWHYILHYIERLVFELLQIYLFIT